MTLALDEAEW